MSSVWLVDMHFWLMGALGGLIDLMERVMRGVAWLVRAVVSLAGWMTFRADAAAERRRRGSGRRAPVDRRMQAAERNQRAVRRGCCTLVICLVLTAAGFLAMVHPAAGAVALGVAVIVGVALVLRAATRWADQCAEGVTCRRCGGIATACGWTSARRAIYRCTRCGRQFPIRV